MRRLALLVAALAALLALPGIAAAHAVLLTSAPADGAILAEPPMAVQLTFSEPVEAVGARVSVIAPDGGDFAVGEPTAGGRTLSALVREGLPEGTATVAWSAISADGHRVSGAFTFSVGAPSAPADPAAFDGVVEPAGALVVTSVVRALRFGGIVAALGLAVVLLAVWAPTMRGGRERDPAAAERADAAFRRPAAWLGAAAPLLVVAAAVAWFPVEAWAGGLGVGEIFSLRQAMVALIALPLALVLAPALALAARGAFPPAPALMVAVLLAAVPALSGHALAEDPAWPSLLGSWAHVVAAGLWAGGVLALAICLPGALRAAGDDARGDLLAGVVRRFTRVALIGLAALVASGAVGAYVYAGSVTGLWDADWGRLVLLKAALVAVAVLLAGLVRRRGSGSVRALGAEAGIVLVVLAVTGVLTGLAPTGSAEAPPGPMSVTAKADGRIAQLTVAPGIAGAPNEVHLIVVDDVGEPELDAADGSVVLSSETVERLPVELELTEAGHWVGSVVIPQPGPWQVTGRFRLGDFDDTAVQGILVVAPPGG